MKSRLSRMAPMAVTLFAGALIGFGCSESARQGDADAKAGAAPAADKQVQRFGQVIGLKPEKKDYYNELHANPWPEINTMLKKCNIRNYSIYETEIDGKLYLFAYFEYTGEDFKKDMEAVAADPKTKEWWKETDPCQIRLAGTPEGQQWKAMEEVYHLD